VHGGANSQATGRQVVVDPDTSGTRAQNAAATAAFDTQTAVERLESKMAEMRTDIIGLKQSTSAISDSQKNMVTMEALDAMMRKYLASPASPTGTLQVIAAKGNSVSQDPQASNQIPVTSRGPVIWSSPAHTLGIR
jgi:TolA-binding protein